MVSLTPREQQVLEQLVAHGTMGRVAAALGISVNTVHEHIKQVYEKLEVNNKVRCVVVAMRLELVE